MTIRMRVEDMPVGSRWEHGSRRPDGTARVVGYSPVARVRSALAPPFTEEEVALINDADEHEGRLPGKFSAD